MLASYGCGGSEERKAEYLEKANQFFSEENYEKAQLEYKNALQIDPKDIEARYQLGLVLEKRGQWKPAMSQYRAVLQQDENHAGANIHVGQIYLLSGDDEHALTSAETALASEPENPAALSLRGAAKAKAGDMAGAFSDGLAALKIKPDHKEATALLATLHLAKKDPVKALEIVNQGIEKNPGDTQLLGLKAKVLMSQNDFDGAGEILQKIIESDPDNMTLRFQLAGFYISQKKIDEAEKTLRVAAAYEKDDDKASLTLIEFLAKYKSTAAAEKEILAQLEADPDSSALQFGLVTLYQSTDIDKGIGILKTIIEQREKDDPDSIKAKSQLAMIYMGQNKTEEARTLANEVLAKSPKDMDALSVRGSIALIDKEPTKAIEDFRTALSSDSNSLKHLRLLARAHFHNNEFALAREALEHGVDVAPEDALAHSELAEVLIKLNEPELAIKEIQKVLAIAPDNAAALETLYKLQSAKRDWNAALSTAEKIKEAFPEKGEGYHLSGLARQMNNDFSSSIDEYTQALEKSPNAVQPLQQLIRGYLAEDKADEALARVEKVMQSNPENYVALNMKGEILLAQKKTLEAQTIFRDVIKLKPDYRTPYLRLATSYAMEDRKDKIAGVYEEGLKSIPEDPVLVTGLATIYEETGNVEQAMNLYEGILIKNPDAALAANNLAMLYVDHFDTADSIEKAKKLTSQLSDTENPAFLDTIGWVDYKAGNYKEASIVLSKAVLISPEEPVLHFHLGMAYLKQGSSTLAKEHLSRAVNSSKDFPNKDEAGKALAELK
jgi:tetratricopeptide (TPR) repeat protein